MKSVEMNSQKYSTMEQETDLKDNLADLSKIPPREFEKHFHEWMERDDVARSLQAKLRSDLIKNFNKTNLGKQLLSKSFNAAGTSLYRLTLSPLILALNTLVAEFLYAQNCHFTLSVFCTEVPFRNALPDFENIRNFRFTAAEISDIWQAITTGTPLQMVSGSTLANNYELEPQNSLLLMILKQFLEQTVVGDYLKKHVEIQTEQTTEHNRNVLPKNVSIQVKDDIESITSESSMGVFYRKTKRIKNQEQWFWQFNKYLQILSLKIADMTNELEDFRKFQHLPRPRSRYRLNRSQDSQLLHKRLECIINNLQEMTANKRKEQRISTIIEVIQILTKQFKKCTENFHELRQTLTTNRRNNRNETSLPSSVLTTPIPTPCKGSQIGEFWPKLQNKSQQTDNRNDLEKSYNDWICEMRNTTNGQKFLNKVENSLHKALSKYKRQLEEESEVKLKYLKGLIKLHYKQKLLTHLKHDYSNIEMGDFQKLKTNFEQKLQEFEANQTDMLKKLHLTIEDNRSASLKVLPINDMGYLQKKPMHNDYYPSYPLEAKHTKFALPIKFSETQKQVDEAIHSNTGVNDADPFKIANNNVENIVNDARLRLKQLEEESEKIEQNFLSYLERRKLEQLETYVKAHSVTIEDRPLITAAELISKLFENTQNYNENQNHHNNNIGSNRLNTRTTSKIAANKRLQSNENTLTKSSFFPKNNRKSYLEQQKRKDDYTENISSSQDETIFKLDQNNEKKNRSSIRNQIHLSNYKNATKDCLRIRSKSSDSSSSITTSSTDLKNAILEAKFKFFEDERKFRKKKEREALTEINLSKPSMESQILENKSNFQQSTINSGLTIENIDVRENYKKQFAEEEKEKGYFLKNKDNKLQANRMNESVNNSKEYSRNAFKTEEIIVFPKNKSQNLSSKQISTVTNKIMIDEMNNSNRNRKENITTTANVMIEGDNRLSLSIQPTTPTTNRKPSMTTTKTLELAESNSKNSDIYQNSMAKLQKIFDQTTSNNLIKDNRNNQKSKDNGLKKVIELKPEGLILQKSITVTDKKIKPIFNTTLEESISASTNNNNNYNSNHIYNNNNRTFIEIETNNRIKKSVAIISPNRSFCSTLPIVLSSDTNDSSTKSNLSEKSQFNNNSNTNQSQQVIEKLSCNGVGVNNVQRNIQNNINSNILAMNSEKECLTDLVNRIQNKPPTPQTSIVRVMVNESCNHYNDKRDIRVDPNTDNGDNDDDYDDNDFEDIDNYDDENDNHSGSSVEDFANPKSHHLQNYHDEDLSKTAKSSESDFWL